MYVKIGTFENLKVTVCYSLALIWLNIQHMSNDEEWHNDTQEFLKIRISIFFLTRDFQFIWNCVNKNFPLYSMKGWEVHVNWNNLHLDSVAGKCLHNAFRDIEIFLRI